MLLPLSPELEGAIIREDAGKRHNSSQTYRSQEARHEESAPRLPDHGVSPNPSAFSFPWAFVTGQQNSKALGVSR